MKKRIPKNAKKTIGKYKLISIYSERLDEFSIEIRDKKSDSVGFLYRGTWDANGGTVSHDAAMRNIYQEFKQIQHTGERKPMMSPVRSY